jgi:signal transduction histidine kinase
MAVAAEEWASSRALLRGETSVGEIIHIQRFDGTKGTILNNATPLRDRKGNVNGAAVAVMDITELTRAQKALEEADRRKDEFLAMLAHELRNPLGAVSNAIEILKRLGPADPGLERVRDAAARQTVHMARLLDDLLDVSRVTQGKIKLHKEEVSIGSILESALEATNPLINARNHRLLVSPPREPMRVHGDRVRLLQAVGNLLQNAAKFTPSGGEIFLGVERDGDQALIVVRDNGIGIEQELLPHVFELFVQGNRSLDRAEGGLGIGLTLVRSLIELHGGSVDAQSDGRGSGSEFRITVPLMPEAERPLGHRSGGEPEKPKPLRILVVDDNADSAEMLATLLGIDGHHVAVANSGRAAIDLALKEIPDIALVDIGMPGMDGYELAQRLRAVPALEHMRLVALTGYGQQEDVQKSREAGFDGHLVKPVDTDTLGQVLKDAARQ